MAFEFLHVVAGISVALLFMGCILFHSRSTAPTLNIILMAPNGTAAGLIQRSFLRWVEGNADPLDCLTGTAQP